MIFLASLAAWREIILAPALARNKDLQPVLYATPEKSAEERRRRSAAVSRKLRLLRAHHLIRKVSGSIAIRSHPRVDRSLPP
jgi:hypothetical protein